MGKNHPVNLGGRPTKLADPLVQKLSSILKIGGTIEEACAYARISKTTYYDWYEKNDGFRTEMDDSSHYSDIVAKNIVVDSMHKDKNLDTAKWWLEKRQFKNNTQIDINQQFNKFEVMAQDGTQIDIK